MNETIANIKQRRSVREYLAKPISKQILEELIDCARQAPSGMNLQPWEFIVVTQRPKLKALGEICTHGSFIKDAAACIVVCGKKSEKWVFEDGSAATENILVAARSLGIGSCWIAGHPKEYCMQIQDLLKIPVSQVVVAILPLGYPKDWPTKQKRALQELLHWEEY
ncbi:MAG: nitroreductase family protein [Candidatus Woesearchaeota archaeon]